jgi:DNA-binding GntR family transcriptional regulator
MELTRLKRERAVDAVHQALRQAILNSLLRPGERLNVEDLAGKLGVSLTPVRHAIQLLEAEGLIVVRPRSGTFVASLTARDIQETFDIRCALECLAAEKAIERITPEELHRLTLRSCAPPATSDSSRCTRN